MADEQGQVQTLAEWPAWLLSLVQPTNGKTKGPAPAIEGPILEGARNTTLTSMAGSMRQRGMSEAAILAALRSENEARCQPPMPDEEVQQIAVSVAKYEPAAMKRTGQAPAPGGQAESKLELPPLLCLADVQPESIDWLWSPRLALKHVTGLEGDPGEGKSFVTHAIATGLSLGKGLPGVETVDISNTLLLTAEDHLPTTVRPRLDSMGATLNHIFACDEIFSLDPDGLKKLEALIIQVSARFVVIDPIVAYLPSGLDLHRANEVRTVMSGLAGIAESRVCAIVIVRHLAKGNTSKAIYRGLGSIDFTAACRSVLLAGHNPDDPNSRALVQIKNNLGPLADPVGYSIEKGQFRWTGATQLTAGQILAPEVEDSSLGEAKALLIETLSKGKRPAQEVEDEAKSSGISTATLRRAKKALGVQAHKDGQRGPWEWELKSP